MSVVALSPRRLDSWIDSFVEQTAATASPLIFRKWAGISAVAGAIERKLWVYTRGANLFPNLYVLLIGPPGVGKSVILSVVDELWSILPEHHRASSSLTRASFIDELAAAERQLIFPTGDPNYLRFNALTASISEFGVLLPAYEYGFMNTLTQIYDGVLYNESRRTHELKIQIAHPFFNMICGTTPSYLGKFMPDGAWDQGFISRNIMVYCGIQENRDPFAEPFALSRADLAKDLRMISEQLGEMKFSKQASSALTAWSLSGGQPAPDHPKLASYISRRTAHLLKLCIISAISRSNTREIDLESYQTALDWLLEAEATLPDIFRSMGRGGDGEAIEECHHFIWTTQARSGKPLSESVVTFFLANKVPSHSVDKVFGMMVRMGLVRHEITPHGRFVVALPKPPGYEPLK